MVHAPAAFFDAVRMRDFGREDSNSPSFRGRRPWNPPYRGWAVRVAIPAEPTGGFFVCLRRL